MQICLDNGTSERLCQLAAEEEAGSLEHFIAHLIEEEDRRRHIDRLPHEGEVRVQCSRELCFETRRRLTALEIEEV